LAGCIYLLKNNESGAKASVLFQRFTCLACNKKLVVQPLRGLDAFSAPQQKRYM